jgi:hypothetical protein
LDCCFYNSVRQFRDRETSRECRYLDPEQYERNGRNCECNFEGGTLKPCGVSEGYLELAVDDYISVRVSGQLRRPGNSVLDVRVLINAIIKRRRGFHHTCSYFENRRALQPRVFFGIDYFADSALNT